MTNGRGHAPSYRRAFIDSLNELARQQPDVLVDVRKLGPSGDYQLLELDLSTARMPRAGGGLPATDLETVRVLVPPWPVVPPVVYVTHQRFVGVPHVLTGNQLCIYLDPSREWDPLQGAVGFMHRLYQWFEDAIAARFDPKTALWHAVGGRAHFTSNDEVVVCKHDLDLSRCLSFAWLTRINERRHLLSSASIDNLDSEQVLVVRLESPLYLGPGNNVEEVFSRLDPVLAKQALEAFSLRCKRRNGENMQDVHIVLAIPNAKAGTHHLQVGRVALDQLKEGPPRGLAVPVQWQTVSDERPSISTRRDASRPVAALAGVDVGLLGCGGLGSWLAEFILRAGAKSIELSDPGRISGGLLVRQNYIDADVADPKAEALARRLRAISPDCQVTVNASPVISDRLRQLTQQEGALIIDATVNVAMAQTLDALAMTKERMAVIAQVITDVATGSLGMVAVSSPGSMSALVLDEGAREVVLSTGSLERYRTFWEPRAEDEMIPALGCSIPTFHGSAADLAGVAAEQINLIARHLTHGGSGTYLFALPHTNVTPPYLFIEEPQA